MSTVPGRSRRTVPVTTLASGHALALTIHVVQGARPGPTVGVSALIHGDEFDGLLIAREVWDHLEPDQLHGAVWILALRQLSLVNFIVIWAAKLMVSFLFVPVVVGLNWRGATRAGAIASMIGGMVACLVWSRYGTPYFLGIDPAEAGVLASALLMVAVSLTTRPVSAAATSRFFGSVDTAGPA